MKQKLLNGLALLLGFIGLCLPVVTTGDIHRMNTERFGDGWGMIFSAAELVAAGTVGMALWYARYRRPYVASALVVFAASLLLLLFGLCSDPRWQKGRAEGRFVETYADDADFRRRYNRQPEKPNRAPIVSPERVAALQAGLDRELEARTLEAAAAEVRLEGPASERPAFLPYTPAAMSFVFALLLLLLDHVEMREAAAKAAESSRCALGRWETASLNRLKDS